MPPDRRVRLLGGACVGLALLFWAVSLPLRCPGPAALLGGFSLLDGFLFGLALARVTHSRRPAAIYGWLMLALLTWWPILAYWPPVRLPESPDGIASPRVSAYLDALRFGLFLLGFPYPFIAFGHHAPDPLPAPGDSAAEDSAPNGEEPN